jgi:hypothetical protein
LNFYKEILSRNLPRLLNLINLDPLSSASGIGDREYWGWKIKDFANATLQGGVHSLAIAVKLGLLNKDHALPVVHQVIAGTEKITNKKGGVGEAYPNENSFCVTALVAFDTLAALNHLKDLIPEEKLTKYIHIIRPLIGFIEKHDEKHAVISNHLATAVAAIILWNDLAKSNSRRHQELLDIIIHHQSAQGWYREYEGSDPGYQTLCTYYLACARELAYNDKLNESLVKSAEFLKYFIHPDGSLGGLYGSRNTKVYYPGGMIALGKAIPVFYDIATGAGKGFKNNVHVLPESIDIGNFVPLLNSYAYAALHMEEFEQNGKPGKDLPFYSDFDLDFSETGLFIKSTPSYYAIINYKKGGTITVFDKKKQILDCEDGGIGGILQNGRKYSTQSFEDSVQFADHKILKHFHLISDTYPTPFRFMILRLFSLTLFKNMTLGNAFKKRVVHMLMTGKKKLKGKAAREFIFQDDKITIKEKVDVPPNTANYGHFGRFKAIHMASAGYFTQHDLTGREISDSNLIEIE